MRKIIFDLLPFCFGYILSYSLRNGNYEITFISIICFIIYLAIILMDESE